MSMRPSNIQDAAKKADPKETSTGEEEGPETLGTPRPTHGPPGISFPTAHHQPTGRGMSSPKNYPWQHRVDASNNGDLYRGCEEEQVQTLESSMPVVVDSSPSFPVWKTTSQLKDEDEWLDADYRTNRWLPYTVGHDGYSSSETNSCGSDKMYPVSTTDSFHGLHHASSTEPFHGMHRPHGQHSFLWSNPLRKPAADERAGLSPITPASSTTDQESHSSPSRHKVPAWEVCRVASRTTCLPSEPPKIDSVTAYSVTSAQDPILSTSSKRETDQLDGGRCGFDVNASYSKMSKELPEANQRLGFNKCDSGLTHAPLATKRTASKLDEPYEDRWMSASEGGGDIGAGMETGMQKCSIQNGAEVQHDIDEEDYATTTIQRELKKDHATKTTHGKPNDDTYRFADMADKILHRQRQRRKNRSQYPNEQSPTELAAALEWLSLLEQPPPVVLGSLRPPTPPPLKIETKVLNPPSPLAYMATNARDNVFQFPLKEVDAGDVEELVELLEMLDTFDGENGEERQKLISTFQIYSHLTQSEWQSNCIQAAEYLAGTCGYDAGEYARLNSEWFMSDD